MLKALNQKGVRWLTSVCKVAWCTGTERLGNYGEYPHTQEWRQERMHCRESFSLTSL